MCTAASVNLWCLYGVCLCLLSASICYIAGAHPRVALVDVSELNPSVEDYRSPRLVVNMFYYFLMGLTHRRAM